MMYRVGVGMRLVRASAGVWGTPAFWDTIGWWHNEVHYVIPRIRGEREMAAELELAFGEVSSGGVKGYVGAFGSVGVTGSGGSTISTNIVPNLSVGEAAITFKDQRVIINSCKSSVGQWQWESVSFRSGRVPTPLRRLLMSVLVGAEWVGDKGRKNPQLLWGPSTTGYRSLSTAFSLDPWWCRPS